MAEHGRRFLIPSCVVSFLPGSPFASPRASVPIPSPPPLPPRSKFHPVSRSPVPRLPLLLSTLFGSANDPFLFFVIIISVPPHGGPVLWTSLAFFAPFLRFSTLPAAILTGTPYCGERHRLVRSGIIVSSVSTHPPHLHAASRHRPRAPLLAVDVRPTPRRLLPPCCLPSPTMQPWLRPLVEASALLRAMCLA